MAEKEKEVTEKKTTKSTAEKKPAAAKKVASNSSAKKPAAEKKPAVKKPATEKAPEKTSKEKSAATVNTPHAKKAGQIKITLVKSLSGRHAKHIATAKSLGLKKVGNFTLQPDNPQTRGKIAQISYMITVS